MLIKFFKLVLILLLFQSPLYSKSKTLNDFNSTHLSNYFSGIVAYDNKNNSEALKFFRSSKFLINQHNSYLERYVYSLILEGKVQYATSEIKLNLKESSTNFFEAHLVLALDSLRRGNYKKSKEHLQRSYKFINNDKIALVIVESLKQYLYVFETNKIPDKKNKFGNFSFINEVFQRCYLDDKNTKTYFEKLINNKDNLNIEGDYSRYIFFYINYLTEKKRYNESKEITDNLYYLNSPLLVSQGKKWVEDQKLKEFKKIFSCKNHNDVIGECKVQQNLISENDYEKSNFYLLLFI